MVVEVYRIKCVHTHRHAHTHTQFNTLLQSAKMKAQILHSNYVAPAF